jgi:hypothetical protein
MLDIDQIITDGVENITQFSELPTQEELQQLFDAKLSPNKAFEIILRNTELAVHEPLGRGDLLAWIARNYELSYESFYFDCLLISENLLKLMIEKGMKPERAFEKIKSSGNYFFYHSGELGDYIDSYEERKEDLLKYLLKNYHNEFNYDEISFWNLPSKNLFELLLDYMPQELMAKKLADYYFFSADISPLYSELSNLFYSKCDFTTLTSFVGPAPSREKLDEMVVKGLPIVQAAKMVSEFHIKAEGGEKYFLKEKQKLLVEYLYSRMTSEELQQIEKLTFLPSRDLMEKMLDKGLVLSKAISLIDRYYGDDQTPVLTQNKKHTLYELIYNRMTSEELRQIEELAFLPSRDLMEKMLDKGLVLSKAISLIDRYRGDDQTPVLTQNKKHTLYELIYNRMTQKDFDSLKEFHFMPSISLMKDMIHNGLSYKKALVLLNKLMRESKEEDHWIFGAKKEELLLSVIIPKAVSENFEPIDFELEALPSKKMVELLKSYGQDVIDKAFAMLVQYVPKTSIERVEYLKLKSEFLEKYSASPKYAISVLEREMKEMMVQKVGISLTVEDGKTDPVYREAYLHLSDGRDIKFNFLGTEHYTSSRVLPQWMIEMAKKSDHFFYEGMSGLIMKKVHEASLLSSKLSFDDVDKPIIKKIAKLYKNNVLKIEGDVLDSEIEQFVSMRSMIANGCRTSLNSAEHFIKNIFNESLSTDLELSETLKMIPKISSTSLFEDAKKVDDISKQIEYVVKDLNAAERVGDKV